LDQALGIADLGAAIHRKVRTYSKGMQQRLALVQVLLSKPELLVLDEPTIGLDPGEMRDVRELIRGLAGHGALSCFPATSSSKSNRSAHMLQ
jgi:ABC-2 type transport system ATP-binding protein